MTPETSDPRPIRVLFVCLGNICRSPLAEGVFRHLAEESGAGHLFDVDSAGTGAWHVGEAPDPRSQKVARKHGIELNGQRARRISPDDLVDFDVVLVMDRDNLSRVETLRDAQGAPARVHLLREFDPEALEDDDMEVPDPYYGGKDGFQRIYEIIDRSCQELLDDLLENGSPDPA